MLGKLNSDQIESLLSSSVIGRIGCQAEGKVYVVPVTYVYEDGTIFGHTGDGMKVNMLRKNPDCCFEVDVMHNLANWESVIAWGTFEELHWEEAKMAMNKLINRFRPIMTSQTSQPSHGLEQAHQHDTKGVVAIIYRIRLREKTGRFEKR